MTAWWEGLPVAEAPIVCGGATHRLRFEQGELRALDHGEGADHCECLALRDAWRRWSGDPRVLVAASRGPSDLLWVEGDTSPPSRRGPGLLRGGGRGGWTSYTATATARAAEPRAAPPPSDEDELGRLLTLGGALPERLVGSVIDRLSATAPADVRLHAALHGRASAAVRGWLGDGLRPVDVRVVDAAAERRISEGDDGEIRLELPIAWLADVFARGLAVVAGYLCLAASNPGDRPLVLQVVGPDLGEVTTIRIDR